jgi:hypothetical protein
MPHDEYEHVKAVKARNRDRLLALPYVVGVGVGPKSTGGREAGPLVIRVYVSEKVPPERLAEGQRIPAEVEGVPTEVIETGEVRLLEKDDEL